MPDFLKDPYGDPFVSEELREFASNLGDSDNENDENIDEADEEELEQIKSALEEEDGSGKYRKICCQYFLKIELFELKKLGEI